MIDTNILLFSRWSQTKGFNGCSRRVRSKDCLQTWWFYHAELVARHCCARAERFSKNKRQSVSRLSTNRGTKSRDQMLHNRFNTCAELISYVLCNISTLADVRKILWVKCKTNNPCMLNCFSMHFQKILFIWLEQLITVYVRFYRSRDTGVHYFLLKRELILKIELEQASNALQCKGNKNSNLSLHHR